MTDRPELRKRPANFVPLSPVSFLARAADFFGDRVAVIHGELSFTYRQFYARSRQLAHALTKAGVKRGLTEDIAGTIARETVLGTAWMAASTGESMESVARRVASPNGTTEAGLAILDRDAVLDDLIAVTIEAAARRGAELAEEARGTPLAEEARLS